MTLARGGGGGEGAHPKGSIRVYVEFEHTPLPGQYQSPEVLPKECM